MHCHVQLFYVVFIKLHLGLGSFWQPLVFLGDAGIADASATLIDFPLSTLSHRSPLVQNALLSTAVYFL